MRQHWSDIVESARQRRSEIVLGIDPLLDELPRSFRESGASSAKNLEDYVELLLEAAEPFVGIVKFQSAFFEALGSSGLRALAFGIGRARARKLGVILDAKRGDIGTTAAAYARAYLDPQSGSDLEVDCMTVNPFLGPETLEPFAACAQRFGKGVLVLVKTSNPGSRWLQDKTIEGQSISMRLAKLVTALGRECNSGSGLSNIGAVVGATFAAEAYDLRREMPQAVVLAPGVGAQGGSVQEVVQLRRADGTGLLVPVSRAITKVDDLTLSRQAYARIVADRLEGMRKLLVQ